MDIFDSLLVFANTIRKEIHENASENIQTSQKKQKTNYEKKLHTLQIFALVISFAEKQ